jgi:hypothetical protein
LEILGKILGQDLHIRKNVAEKGRPLFIEVSMDKKFLPVVVSSTRWDKFITVNKVSKSGLIRVGIFDHDPDRIEDVLAPMFDHAFALSEELGSKNVFHDPLKAFNYIKKSCGEDGYPQFVLVPESMPNDKLNNVFGKDNVSIVDMTRGTTSMKSYTSVFNKSCSIVPCKTNKIVFLSKSEYVGLQTQILGGLTGILLHNVKLGTAFVTV